MLRHKQTAGVEHQHAHIGVAINFLRAIRTEHSRADAERRELHPDERGASEKRHVEHRALLTHLDHDERLRAMADRASAFGRPHAAERLAELVVRVGEGAA